MFPWSRRTLQYGYRVWANSASALEGSVTGIMDGHRQPAGMAQQLRPQDPQKIGPYWLLGRLGGGGMGEVFLGRSPGGRLVAVEVVRPDLAAPAQIRHRLAR